MPTVIGTQFPIARLSAESYKERRANNSQTLTRLGKWGGGSAGAKRFPGGPGRLQTLSEYAMIPHAGESLEHLFTAH